MNCTSALDKHREALVRLVTINCLQLFADRVAVMILGIITLIIGILFTSIPWLDYCILRVSFWKYIFKSNLPSDLTFFHLPEPPIVEQHAELSVLAKAGRGSTNQSLHIQCDKSGRVSQRREAQVGRGRAIRIQGEHGEDKYSVPRELYRLVSAQ